MTTTPIPLGFGTYLVATQDYIKNQQILCRRSEIALVFSRHRSANTDKPYDLLMEKGSTLFGLAAADLHRHFRAIYHDPHVIFDGCSTNHGWQAAHNAAEAVERETTDRQ